MIVRILELLFMFVLFFGGAAAIIATYLVLTGRLQLGEYKSCPYCAERIRKQARICRYCQRDVRDAEFENRPKGLFQ